MASVFAVILYLYPLRGRGLKGETLPHRRLFTVSQHRRFGWVALGLAGLHTTIVLVAQPLTVRYLLPSAPIYMLCGIGALAALAILVPTGLSTRASMRRPPARAVAGISHAAVAALLLGLLGAHLVGSAQLVDTPVKSIAVCVLLALPLLWTAVRTRAERLRGGYWAATVVAIIVGATLLLLPIRSTTARLLEPAARASETLPLHFPHEMHTSVNCVACHHNFRDDTGTANCVDCHRSAREDLVRSSESTFHVFCRDCHRDLAREGRRHGPTRTCQPCHH
ncbi:MAG: cytochrome c3 family protein [Steroidobacteraceae bacterium]